MTDSTAIEDSDPEDLTDPLEFLEALDSSTKEEAEKIAASIYRPLIDALRKAKKIDDIDARAK